MRGLWTKETMDLAIAVGNGNPGALRVIDELLWFSDWFKMMEWCRDNGFTGSKLWEQYKDVFGQDFMMLGDWIKKHMWQDEKEMAILRPKGKSKLPKKFRY